MWKSFSSLNQFLNCERQWFYQRVAKKPRPPSHYLSIGSLYHHVFEMMVRDDLWSSPELIELIHDLYVEHSCQDDWKCPTTQENLCAEIYANAVRVRDQVFMPLAADELVAEKSHKYLAQIDVRANMIPKVEMAQIVGSEPGECILDYKIKFSTWNRRGQEDADNSAQLALYCILEGVHDAFYVEVPRSTKASINVIGKRFTDEELAWWSRFYDQQTAAINSRDKSDPLSWRLSDPANSLCSKKFCPYWGDCPGGGLPSLEKDLDKT